MVREIPLKVFFSWPQPNYTNPETRGPALIIVNAVFISLCTITLFLRLYTRIFIKRWFGSDDVFIILAYVRPPVNPDGCRRTHRPLQISTVGLTTNVIIAHEHYFWSRHVWDIPITSFPGMQPSLTPAFS